MDSCGCMRQLEVLDDQRHIKTMIESSTFAQNSDYVAENRIKATVEADSQQIMVVEENIIENNKIGEIGENLILEGHMLDCI